MAQVKHATALDCAQTASEVLFDPMQQHRDEEEDDEELDGDLEEDEQLEGAPESKQSLRDEVHELKHNMTYISHQVTLLMNALHVPACKCEVCTPRYRDQLRLFTNMKDPSVVVRREAQPDDCNNRQTQQQQGVMTTAQQSEGQNAAGTQPNANEYDGLLSQLFTQAGMGALNTSDFAGVAQALGFDPKMMANNAGSNSGGRRSKYCSATEKRAVAEYANVHGASAAARKFNIPPPVAAYYHRKQFKQNTRTSGATLSSQRHAPISVESPGTASGDDVENSNGDWNWTQPPTPQGVNGIFKMDQQQKLNPAHSSGSPGFLRGRGRGRPKLIGDELDAELVDYMVQVKQSDPRGHLTASQALVIARDYILDKAPGLLEEHGGHIKLKLTWAMKLVSRIGERQKEIELGLPAGTFSNMTRSTANLPGGNLMADMMAQNMLSQQMTQIMNQTVSGSASATPQILNVRELKLPKQEEGAEGVVNGECAVKADDHCDLEHVTEPVDSKPLFITF